MPAQLFERASGGGRRPAVVYVHGGPPRQMLLGWHYSDYYANAYAVNQHLASRGFVVLIHADDDRNVRFAQTVDLARRLAARGVEYEELVFVDDTHHWMRHANQVRVNQATVRFLERKLGR